MFRTINEAYSARKREIAENAFLMEAALEVDEVLPGSEDEMEDAVDVDSVPDDVYRKIDAALDKIVNDPKYDDTEVEELTDDDFDENEVSDAELEAVIEESADIMRALSWQS